MSDPIEPSRPSDIIFPEAKRVESISNRTCVQPPIGCGKPITVFKDELSRKEYHISGLCQECQDLIFAEPKPSEDDIDPNYGDPKD